MSSLISSSASGADIHVCTTRLPVPPHGVGVVIDGSKTVLINNLAACRLGDTILEAVGPPDKIAKGEMTVIHFSRRNSQVETLRGRPGPCRG